HRGRRRDPVETISADFGNKSWRFRCKHGPVKARRPFIASVAAFLVIAVGFVAPQASAQGKAEAPAKALQRKAMDEDYLTTEFGKAAEKLEKAIKQCGDANCGAPLRAQLRRDLGVVQIGGQLDKEKGIQNLVEALKID